MPRQPHHSSNWGGKRAGAGRKLGSSNKYTEAMVEKAKKYKVHPVDLLLMVVNDENETMHTRLNAAVHVLPYVAPKQMAVAVEQVNELDGMTEDQKLDRLRGLVQTIKEKRPTLMEQLESVASEV